MMQKLTQLWNRLSVKNQQWAWFVILWCGGFFSLLTLAYLIRVAMGIQ